MSAKAQRAGLCAGQTCTVTHLSSFIQASQTVTSVHDRREMQVLAVPLPRRPLFPGNIMPVSVQDPRLVKELLELKRSRLDTTHCADLPIYDCTHGYTEKSSRRVDSKSVERLKRP